MMNRIKRKLNSKGYTLTEMLCVIVVVVLVSGCLTLGIDLSKDSLESTTTYSRLQMLSSTLSAVISDELRYAREVKSSGSTISYTSNIHGSDSTIKCNSQGQLVLSSSIDTEFPLVASSSYFNSKLKDNDISISYDSSTRIFTVSFILEAKNGYTKNTTFMVKALNTD